MACVYTISHPFSNEIVYVGCTKNINHRVRNHISSNKKTPLGFWIQDLINSYIIPKIESIDIVEESDMLYFERYWIQQFQVWGFNLFNENKTLKIRPSKYKEALVKEPKIIKVYVKKTAEQWAKERLERKIAKIELKVSKSKNKDSRKWNRSSFDIGKIYEIDANKRRSFKEMFRQYAHSFGIEVHLSEQKLEDKLIFTVCNGSREYLPSYGVTKSGIKRYKPLQERVYKQYPAKKWKVTRYKLGEIKIGDEITVPNSKLVSFGVAAGNYRTVTGEDKWFNYTKVDLNVICKCVLKQDVKHFIEEQKVIEIFKSNLSIKEVAKKYNITISTAWNIKNFKRYKNITEQLETNNL